MDVTFIQQAERKILNPKSFHLVTWTKDGQMLCDYIGIRLHVWLHEHCYVLLYAGFFAVYNILPSTWMQPALTSGSQATTHKTRRQHARECLHLTAAYTPGMPVDSNHASSATIAQTSTLDRSL
eukprot:8286476-Pyramimonas_sp.AAC.1